MSRGGTEVTIEYVVLNKLAFLLVEIPSFELKFATKLSIGKDDVFMTSLLDFELLEVVGVPAFPYMRVMVLNFIPYYYHEIDLQL